ncbi:MAG: hypothetical protein PHQ25_09105 [Acidobacteriota bacterium]|nr:hypothetical protein [Acidobacteriota bacterium]
MVWSHGFSEENVGFKPKFHFKVSGGFLYAAIGDMNKHLNSMDAYYRNYYGELASGEIKSLNNGASDFEVEIMRDLSRKLRLGLGVSVPIHLENESRFYGAAIDVYRVDHEKIFRPEIKVWMPAKLSLYYSIFSKSRMNLYFYSGISLYSVKMNEERLQFNTYPSGSVYYNTAYIKVKKKLSPGWQAGLSFEYDLLRNLSLVGELEGHVARISHLKGGVEWTTNYGGESTFGDSGELYFYGSPDSYYEISIGAPPHLMIIEPLPPGYVERPARLDMSRFSIRFGLKISL